MNFNNILVICFIVFFIQKPLINYLKKDSKNEGILKVLGMVLAIFWIGILYYWISEYFQGNIL